MQQSGENMKEKILKQIKPIQNYEVYLQNSIVNELQIQKNKIYFDSITNNKGYGIRIHDGGLGFSSSNDDSISSGWAYSHSNATGLGYHVPTGGAAGQYLDGSGSWSDFSSSFLIVLKIPVTLK